jgi:hypothetical protein
MPNQKLRDLSNASSHSLSSRDPQHLETIKDPARKSAPPRPFKLYGKSTPVILVDKDENSALLFTKSSVEADNVMGKGKGKLLAISEQLEDESAESFPEGWDAECGHKLVKCSKKVKFVLEGPPDEGFETENWLFYMDTLDIIELMQRLFPKDESG